MRFRPLYIKGKIHLEAVLILLAVFLGIGWSSQAAVEKERKLTDQAISDVIEDKFHRDGAVNVNDIDVETKDGIVNLKGSVNNLLAKERAAHIAGLVKGVRAINNRIRVKPALKSTDSTIQNRIEQEITSHTALNENKINVSVEDGVVILTGETGSWAEKELYARIAKGVKGVVQVINDLKLDYTEVRDDAEIKPEILSRLPGMSLSMQSR